MNIGLVCTGSKDPEGAAIAPGGCIGEGDCLVPCIAGVPQKGIPRVSHVIQGGCVRAMAASLSAAWSVTSGGGTTTTFAPQV